MLQAGITHTLKVIRKVDFGVYLDDGGEGILLPKRFVPAGLAVGDEIKVFLYHDGEERLIATTQKPKAQIGDIIKLTCVSTTPQGAFLDLGLMKDLFVPKSKQINSMRPQGEYLVQLFTDEQTGRMAATEKIEELLDNTSINLEVKQAVDLIVLRRTDLGYVVIVDGKHTGLLHHNEIYRNIGVGDKFKGFIKKIYLPDGQHDLYRIDVSAGTAGYARVEGESDKILRMLAENNGSLPFHDKTDAETIYEHFAMSKKTFKMTLGKLYKEKKINLLPTGIELA